MARTTNDDLKRLLKQLNSIAGQESGEHGAHEYELDFAFGGVRLVNAKTYSPMGKRCSKKEIYHQMVMTINVLSTFNRIG